MNLQCGDDSVMLILSCSTNFIFNFEYERAGCHTRIYGDAAELPKLRDGIDAHHRQVTSTAYALTGRVYSNVAKQGLTFG
jgi:hypothetical protein